MLSFLKKYTRWIHTGFPAGGRIALPQIDGNGTCAVDGVYIVGDLTGRSLLKYSLDSGARAVRSIAKAKQKPSPLQDLIILGAGVAGLSAALEAKSLGLSFSLVEVDEPFSTIVNYPKRKPIFTYPPDFQPSSKVALPSGSFHKEELAQVLKTQFDELDMEIISAKATHLEREKGGLVVHLEGKSPLRAQHVIVALGKSGERNRLDVPGENLPHVFNRLFDPFTHAHQKALIVGGGDSALEAAIALQKAGAKVFLSYRGQNFIRPKSELLSQVNALANTQSNPITLLMGTTVNEFKPDHTILTTSSGETKAIPNDIVFTLIGQRPPLEFFRRSKIPLKGEWSWKSYASLVAFLLFCVFLYNWKSDNQVLPLLRIFDENDWFPFNFDLLCDSMGEAISTAVLTQGHFLQTLAQSMGKPSFYYTIVYSMAVVIFGVRRIKKRRTSYITAQTLALMAFQVFPLFILPEILLPWAGNNGWFLEGTTGGQFANHFFESYDAEGMNRAYWRSYGFILAWPLFIWNVFTHQPMWAWLWVSVIQTFVLIPWIIWKWGKGAYCGWICSCGALAETLGDDHRHKMPHGTFWNRFNMLGQIILGIVFFLLLLRVLSWIFPNTWFESVFWYLLSQVPFIHYSWFVDILLSGILGVGLYFWFSGRTWCRFACPLAALMHIYARFSRFRIFSDKKKCISCNECTETCHQGIHVMHFAQQGLPMNDPECVRCSACVQTCPTGVLTFGQLNPKTQGIQFDKISARTSTKA